MGRNEVVVLSEKARREAVATITRHFSSLADRRVRRKVTHPLMTVIVVALLGTICGADGWDQLEVFAQENAKWLRELVDLSGGLPSDDTFRRVFMALVPKVFAKCVFAWLNELAGPMQGEVVAIDGKSIRRSFWRATSRSPMHMVHAWAVKRRMLLGQLATDAKSNEITAIPALLEAIEIRGATVTIDAAGCQHTIAEKIVSGGGDYVLAVKENQPKLHAEIAAHFAAPLPQNEPFNSVETTNKSHGRNEYRRVMVSDIRDLPIAREWEGARSVVCIDRCRVDTKIHVSVERAYYISTHSPRKVEAIAQAVRAHWSIENTLHWCLDITFREDESRVRERNATENLALLRRIALNLFKHDTLRTGSIRTKRQRAGYNPDYALQVLASARPSTVGIS